MGDPRPAAFDLGTPAAIEYETMGLDGIKRRCKKIIQEKLQNLHTYRENYASAYFKDGPQAEQYWTMINGFEFSEQEDDTEDSDAEAETALAKRNRRKRKTRVVDSDDEDMLPIERFKPRQSDTDTSEEEPTRQQTRDDSPSPKRRRVHKSGRLNYVSPTDDFCLLCDTNAVNLVDNQNQPIHARIQQLIDRKLAAGMTFQRVVPEIYIFYNFVLRPLLRDMAVPRIQGCKAKIVSCHHTGVIPAPRWTVSSIINHYVHHCRVPNIADCVLQTELQELSSALVSRIIPADSTIPVNTANLQAYERLVKLQMSLNSVFRRNANAQ
jgi:hypothetical protein